MKPNKKLTHFVSEIDLFLQEYDKKHPGLTETQRKERDKHLRIYKLRDVPNKNHFVVTADKSK